MKALSQQRLIRGLILFAWMAVIFAFSAIAGSPYARENPPLWYFLERKGAHVVEYAILMLLAFRFFLAFFPKEKFLKLLLLSGIFSLAYGVSDELHQFFVPYRGAKVTDVLIDGLGILLMAFLLWLLRPSPKKKRKTPTLRRGAL